MLLARWKETKEVGVNFFDPGEILNGGFKRKTKLCLSVGPTDCVWLAHTDGMRFLPLTGRSAYRGHSSFTKSFVAWSYSRMLVKMNLFHPFLAIVKTNWGYGDIAGTPPSLSKVTIFFHGAGPTSPTGYRGEINPQVRVTLSRGDLLKNISKADLVGKESKVSLGCLQQAQWEPVRFLDKRQIPMDEMQTKELHRIRIMSKILGYIW